METTLRRSLSYPSSHPSSHSSHPKPYHKNNIFEAKQWNFEETNALMEIWSQIDFNSFQTKSLCYKQIQTQLKKRGFERNSEQIRCKIKRLTSKRDPKDVCQRPHSTVAYSSKSDDKYKRNDSNLYKQYISSELETHLIENDIHLSEESTQESESELYFLSKKSCVSKNLKQTDIKRRVSSADIQTKDCLLEDIKHIRDETSECFKEIMCGNKELKQSIEDFNQQLIRLTQTVDKQIDFDFDKWIQSKSEDNSATNELPNRWLKIVIPNVCQNMGTTSLVSLNENIPQIT